MSDNERPAWLPPKFATPEDLAKSYTELERAYHRRGSGGGVVRANAPKPDKDPPAPVVVPVPAGNPNPNATTPDQESTEAPKATEESPDSPDDGLSPEIVPGDPQAVPPPPANQELSEAVRAAMGGPLDQQTKERLVRAGIPEDAIVALQERMTQGQMAVRQLAQLDATKDIGGLERWQTVADWADVTLSEEEKDVFNNLLSRGGKTARAAVNDLHGRYVRSLGPKRIEGSKVTEEFPGYRSRAEQIRDMKDPRYATDHAFRQEVARKTALGQF